MPEGRPHKISNFRFALRVIWLLIRGLALIPITLLLVAVLAVLLAPRFFDGERTRDLIVAELSDVLKRPVQIQSVVLTPQGVKLQGIKVYSKLDPAHPLLESRIALATVKLEPLLDKRLELSHIRLVEPRVRIWRDESGVWNIADLFPSTATARPAQRLALPIDLAAETTDIEGGAFEVEDRLKNTSTRFDQVYLTLHRFAFDKPFPVSARFDNTSRFGEREYRASVSLDGTLNLASGAWSQAYLRAERLEAKIDDHVVRGSAGLEDFGQLAIDADLLVPALGPPDWDRYIKKAFEFNLPPSRWRARVKFAAPGVYKFERLQATAGPVTATAAGTLDLSGDKPRMEAFVTAAESPLTSLAAFKPSIAHFKFAGTGSGEAGLSGWTDKLVVHRAKLHLRGFSSLFTRFSIEGADLDAEASQDFSRFAVRATKGSVAAYGHKYTDVAGALTIANQDLKLERLAFRWADSKILARGSVTNLLKPKQVELSANVDKLRWEKAQDLVNTIIASVSTRTAQGPEDEGTEAPWVETFKYKIIPKRFPDTIGSVHIGQIEHKNFSLRNADFLWDVRGVTQKLNKVNGDVYVGFGGEVRDIPAVQEANKFLKIVFLPYIFLRQMIKVSNLSLAQVNAKSFDFNRIDGDFSVNQGVVDTHYIHVDSPELILYSDGTMDFAKQAINFSVLTRLNHVASKLPEYWEDEKGRPGIGFGVKGDLDRPGLEPRFKKIKEFELEQDIEKGASRAKARFAVIKKLEMLEEKQ